jgi:hypothetical protein
LDELERNSIGLHLGDIYVGTPTCADDLALLSSSVDEMQLMLNVVHRYSQQHFYNLHSTKTNIVEFSKQNNIENSWKLDGNKLCTTRSTTHLGLERSDKQESEINIEERIKTSRRTKYSLMSSGLHGTNDIDPTTFYNIYKLYVLPRLLYGLEILAFKTRDIEKLDRFHKGTLRQFQSLPKRAVTAR